MDLKIIQFFDGCDVKNKYTKAITRSYDNEFGYHNFNEDRCGVVMNESYRFTIPFSREHTTYVQAVQIMFDSKMVVNKAILNTLWTFNFLWFDETDQENWW